MDFTGIIPRELHRGLAWLGKLDWLRFSNGSNDDGIPRTRIMPQWHVIQNAKGVEQHSYMLQLLRRFTNQSDMLGLAFMEACGIALAEGPKLFVPSVEQWESMEQVEIHLPISEFRSPYPTLIIRIPNECRKRLATEHGVDIQRAPLFILVRYRKHPAESSAVIFLQANFKDYENANIFQDQTSHKDVEAALSTRTLNEMDAKYPERDNEFKFCDVLNRAALNLCLMLTHFGHKVTGPLDPHSYKINRKRAGREHLKYGDFLAVQMIQNICVRATPEPTEPGEEREGGWEVKPHWRRGHWRRKPGWEEFVKINQPPPLVFVRPTLVRKDRIQGDVGQSRVTYTVK